MIEWYNKTINLTIPYSSKLSQNLVDVLIFLINRNKLIHILNTILNTLSSSKTFSLKNYIAQMTP
jgi:hypothetical protein